MIALCKNCGLVFKSRMFSFKGSTNVTISDVGEPCPNCGYTASLLDGTFDFDENGNAVLVSGPPLTSTIVKALKDLVLKAKQENFTPQKFIEEANSISPEAGSNLAKLVPNSFADIIAFFVLILSVLTYIENKQTKPEVINNFKVENNYYTDVKQLKSDNKAVKKVKTQKKKKKKIKRML